MLGVSTPEGVGRAGSHPHPQQLQAETQPPSSLWELYFQRAAGSAQQTPVLVLQALEHERPTVTKVRAIVPKSKAQARCPRCFSGVATTPAPAGWVEGGRMWPLGQKS